MLVEECPACHGAVREVRAVVQYIEDIPLVQTRVTELTTHCGYCPCCQKEVRSTHPLQVSLAEGAAAVQLGTNALAVACQLSKQHGLTVRKTQAVLRSLFGLSLTPGGLVHAMKRMADRLRPRYDAMIQELRQGPMMHSDETSWWVGGPGWWLWVFTTPKITIYHVAQGRGRAVLLNVMSLEFEGALVSDCLNIYDDVNRLQHKCYAHHLISQAIEQGPSDYLNEVHGLLQGAMALKKAQAEMALQKQSECRAALDQRANELLTLPRSQPLEERVRCRLFKQRDHLFTFLDHAPVPATNNLAERQLRPAVIARKLSCGNKTPAGAQTWEVLASLAATCKQCAQSFGDLVASVARPPPLLGR